MCRTCRRSGMRYSRTGIILVLVGAEIFIAGAILWALGGHPWAASGAQRISYSPKTFDPIDAGSTPHVRIDDADSTVTVNVSADGRVHVEDNTHFVGAIWSSHEVAQLSVERTADGVRVYRPSEGNNWFSMGGWAQRDITVSVPTGATVEIENCSGADLSGITGQVRAHSSDGHISARDLRGDADLSSDDGHIDVSNVQAKRLAVSTSDGSLNLNDINVDDLHGSSSDGSIRASGLQINSGVLQTSDGSIELALTNSNLSVHAHTDDGRVSYNGRSIGSSGDDDDSSTGDFNIGTGGGSLQVTTQDGSIRIAANGV